RTTAARTARAASTVLARPRARVRRWRVVEPVTGTATRSGVPDGAPARPPGAAVRENAVLRWARDHGVHVAVGVLLLFNLVFTPNFATVGNLRLQLVQVVPVAIVALGMALVVATEGIDLSVGS